MTISQEIVETLQQEAVMTTGEGTVGGEKRRQVWHPSEGEV
jgi:hypothetical protein